MHVSILDSVLREGVQSGRISFSVDEKLAVARKLDEFGVDYIEGGWPGSDANDAEFFRRAKGLALKHAKLVAFGPVRAASRKAADDPHLAALVEAGAPAASVYANLIEITGDGVLKQRVADSVAFLKQHVGEVIFDAANFFDAYEANPQAAIEVLWAARENGAELLVLCDSAGRTQTERLERICEQMVAAVGGELGIHAHNACGLGVANTLAAVMQGFTHVQGTVNGYGARNGVADLVAVLGNLARMGVETRCGGDVPVLRELSAFVAGAAHVAVDPQQAFTGGGVSRNPATLEHWISQFGFADRLGAQARRELADRVHQLESEGYDLDAADGTVELLLRQAAAPDLRLFEVGNYAVATRGSGAPGTHNTATVSLDMGETAVSATAEGNGPIHAMEQALRECLSPVYPSIREMRLVNYQLRVADPQQGSAAKARVYLEWEAGGSRATTLGVSENLLEASWLALVDGMRLELLRLAEREPNAVDMASDSSWAV
jgi:2-isopropylmalate synthase